MVPPWSSVGLATGYRGKSRVSTARPPGFHCPCASTASATVVAMAQPAVLSMAPAVEFAMATYGSTAATATASPMVTSTSIAAIATAFNGNCHGNSPTSIATAIHGDPRQLPRNCHVNRRQLPRQLTRQSTASAEPVKALMYFVPKRKKTYLVCVLIVSKKHETRKICRTARLETAS